jgi:hypothetical protein
MAASLAALAACDMQQEAAFRLSPGNDYYEAVGLTEIGRKFRREAPFYVDLSTSGVLDAEARERLAGQAAWMEANPSLRFMIIAMARADGGAVSPDDPAHARAAAVADHLGSLGIATDRVRARVVPIGVGNVDFDPLQRVTTLVEDGVRSRQPGLLAALARDGRDAGSVGAAATAGGGEVGRSSRGADLTSGPRRTSSPVADGPRGGTSSDPGGSGRDPGADQGPGDRPSSNPDTSGPGPDSGNGPSDPGPSKPEGKKNDAKREANSGRGNGDEDGDPGKSGGRNRGGDELG